MKKKFIALTMLATLAVMAGQVHLSLAQDSSGTSVSTNNVAPTFSSIVDDSDNTSAVGGPTNVGSNVTFTATASDTNADSYYLAICKTNSISPNGSGAAPTCGGGNWGSISTATASGSPVSVTYTALVGDVESNAWYAFACDNNSAGSMCSAMSQGTGTSDQNSPFFVNHKPSFTALSITDATDGTIQPGDTIKFKIANADLDDTDSNAAQDTVRMYICSGQADQGGVTTAFDVSSIGSNPCTGGTLLCSDTNGGAGKDPTAADLTCNDGSDIVSIPTAAAIDYTVFAYVIDNHEFAATDTASYDYAVTNVAPVVDSFDTLSTITLTAGSSVPYTVTVNVHDNNGDGDLDTANGKIFDTTNACSSDNNDCYVQATCTYDTHSTGSGKTAKGSAAGAVVTCSYSAVYFNANASSTWNAYAQVIDDVAQTGTLDSGNFTVNALTAIDIQDSTGVTGANISYEALAPGSNSGTFNDAGATVALANVGNQLFDSTIFGSDMCTSWTTPYTNCGGDSISANQQQWTTDNTQVYGTGVAGTDYVALTGASSTPTASCTGATRNTIDTSAGSGTTLSIRNAYTDYSVNVPVYFGIAIPGGQPSGSYTGQNTFAFVAANECSL